MLLRRCRCRCCCCCCCCSGILFLLGFLYSRVCSLACWDFSLLRVRIKTGKESHQRPTTAWKSDEVAQWALDEWIWCLQGEVPNPKPVFPPRSHSSGAPPLLNFLRRCNKNPSPNFYLNFFYVAPFRKCTARNVNCAARGTSSRNQHQRRKIHSECGSCWQ